MKKNLISSSIALLLTRSSMSVNGLRLRQHYAVEEMNLEDYTNPDQDVTAYAASISSGKKFTDIGHEPTADNVEDPSKNAFFMALDLDKEKKEAETVLAAHPWDKQDQQLADMDMVQLSADFFKEDPDLDTRMVDILDQNTQVLQEKTGKADMVD